MSEENITTKPLSLELFEEIYGDDIEIEAAELGDQDYEELLEKRHAAYLNEWNQDQ